MPKQQILFIINPISGSGKPIDWESLIPSHLDTNQFDYQIKYTKRKGDGIKISSDAAKKETDIVCAVGGDGTINEVAQGLINSNSSLAIIPRGSGNGLARHFSIPVTPSKALHTINRGKSHNMDVGYLNKKLFLCVAGIGFDATVAKAFDEFGKRGLLSYALLSVKKFFAYRPFNYSITIDQKEIKTKAFLIAFANASQFGNNAYIAPEAKTDDGLLNLTIIKPFPLWATPDIILKTFNKKIHQSKYTESYTFRSLTLKSNNPTTHIDGEPIDVDGSISVSLNSNSLKIIY